MTNYICLTALWPQPSGSHPAAYQRLRWSSLQPPSGQLVSNGGRCIPLRHCSSFLSFCVGGLSVSDSLLLQSWPGAASRPFDGPSYSAWWSYSDALLSPEVSLDCDPVAMAVIALTSITVTVKHESFKKCSQSGFCKRNRAFADDIAAKGSSWSSPYELDPSSIRFKDGQLEGTIFKTISANDKVRLPLSVSFLESGAARVVVDEEKRLKGDIELRHDSKARKQRYNEAEKWAVVGGLELSKSASLNPESETGFTKVLYGPDQSFQAIIHHSPFNVEFQREGQTHVQFNKKGYMNMEHWRPKVDDDTEEDQSTWWEENFGGNTDSKPRGPESVGLDITFPGYGHVFGIPEHADSMSLRETR